MSRIVSKDQLEGLYHHFNRRGFVHPDPLQFLYDYPQLGDREIVAFVASSLAYGRVAQILTSVSSVLERMAPSPVGFLTQAPVPKIRRAFSGFKHRFTDGNKLSAMLIGLKGLVKRHGSLHACFRAYHEDGSDTVLPALSAFVRELTASADDPLHHLVPSPEKGSACKRLNLFLRWMVRTDDVDPGGWDTVQASKLVVPIDTHMHKIGRIFGMTTRKQANMKTAREITDAFRTITPEDPARYDFSLTRLGILENRGLVCSEIVDAWLDEGIVPQLGRASLRPKPGTSGNQTGQKSLAVNDKSARKPPL